MTNDAPVMRIVDEGYDWARLWSSQPETTVDQGLLDLLVAGRSVGWVRI